MLLVYWIGLMVMEVGAAKTLDQERERKDYEHYTSQIVICFRWYLKGSGYL